MTSGASRIRGTAAARPAMTDQHSMVSPSRGAGPGPFGMKWSAKYTPSQPVCSQWVASSRISSQDRVGEGQMLKRITGILSTGVG